MTLKDIESFEKCFARFLLALWGNLRFGAETEEQSCGHAAVSTTTTPSQVARTCS